MRYLFAILCPPLALLLCNRPLQALLNVPLCLACGLPGMIHALMLVGQTLAEDRQAELVLAMTGKPMPRKAHEWDFLAACVGGLLLLGAGALLLTGVLNVPGVLPEKKTASVAVSKSLEPIPAKSWQAPAILGWTLAEVESRHGKALSLDKATGVAVWPDFQATFQTGVVMRVDPP